MVFETLPLHVEKETMEEVPIEIGMALESFGATS